MLTSEAPGLVEVCASWRGRHVHGSVTVKSPGILLVWSRPFPVHHDFIYLWSSWEASGDRIGIPPKILMSSTAEELCTSKGILASWGVLLCSCGSFPEMSSLPIASRRQFFCRLRPCLFLILESPLFLFEFHLLSNSSCNGLSARVVIDILFLLMNICLLFPCWLREECWFPSCIFGFW